MVEITIDLSKVGMVVAILYGMGMSAFLGYILGKGRGFDEGLDSGRKIYK